MTLLNIRTKVIVLLSAVFLVFALVEWGVGEKLLLPRFEQIERDNALTAMKRIDAGLTEALDSLQVSATDWGNWADSYRFMLDHNPGFASETLDPQSMRQLHLTAVAFIDLQGDIIRSNSLDPESYAPLTLELIAHGALPAAFPWLKNLRTGAAGHGLIATEQGVMLAAVAPILDGFGHGPSRGLVLMGRLLTAAEIAAIGTKAHTAVAVVAQMPATAIVTDEHTTQVFQSFNDIFGRPILILRVDVPRNIIANARTTVNAAMGFTLGAAVATLLFMLMVLNRTVFEPLAHVTRHAVAIGAGDDLTTRLNLQRSDEIGALAREFDRMVAQVAESRRQLIDHSFNAGMAEFSRGVLHNIGNAMTPLSVRLAKLQERLRAAPLADVGRALSECSGGAVAAARQADLDQFLRLASGELAEVITAADGDVAMMIRQAALVQNALSERLPSTRAPTVLELVELPAMIHQSLEIVPDVWRERLDIELDRSLQLVGPVRIARTVLRLVLQNLIINAAEAVRAGARERGSLRFCAALLSEDGQTRLQIQCRDNGVGIEAANLQRVFERGYSTKRGSANSGIGLHWCATAVNALGGRIWASSAGLGHGTTIHLVMPVSTPEMAASTIAA